MRTLLASLVLALAGCAPAELPVVVIPPAAGTTSAPVVLAAEPAIAPPVEAPKNAKNPFASGQQWRGTYVCAQGETELFLQIDRVDGDSVQAVFAFFHDASGASGAYRLSGQWEPRAARVSFVPGEWMRQPSGYVSVGLSGTVADGTYSGKVDNATCGGFSVKLLPAQDDEDWD